MSAFRAFRNLPLRHYQIVYADPPWRFDVWDRDSGLGKSPDKHYRTATLADLCAVNVGAIAAPNAMLIMWVYDPMIPEALQLGAAWGFTYKTVLFRWRKVTRTGKPHFSTGRHTRGGACEEAFVFARGDGLPVLRHDIRREFEAPIRAHSQKPDEVPGWLVDLYGARPRVELFARLVPPGWDGWGDQARMSRKAA